MMDVMTTPEWAETAVSAGDLVVLRLYVAGQTPKSVAAIANLKRLCAGDASVPFSIEVVDLTLHPELARGDQIVAIPTLVRRSPLPVRRVIGDLSNSDRVLVRLELRLNSRK